MYGEFGVTSPGTGLCRARLSQLHLSRTKLHRHLLHRHLLLCLCVRGPNVENHAVIAEFIQACVAKQAWVGAVDAPYVDFETFNVSLHEDTLRHLESRGVVAIHHNEFMEPRFLGRAESRGNRGLEWAP